MNSSHDPLDSASPALRDLLIELTEQGVTPDASRRLADLLRDADDPTVDLYLDYIALHANLTRTYVKTPAPLAPPKPDLSEAKVRMPSRPFHISPVILSLAAAFLLTAAAVAIYVFAINRQSEIRNPKSDAPPIATLIESTGTVVVNDNVAHPGGEYEGGDFTIDAGRAQFILRSRVTVDLEGRTRLHVRERMHAALSEGTVTFHCPIEAVGYTVDLPDGVRVVDLGTRFRVSVGENGKSRVAVLEGRVRVDYGQGLSRVLTTNETAHLADGLLAYVEASAPPTAQRDVTVSDGARFVADAPESLEPGALVDPDRMVMIPERTGVEVPAGTRTGIAATGRFAAYAWPANAQGVAAEPIRVDSFLIHFDPQATAGNAIRRSATFEFDRSIVGVIGVVGLIQTDEMFGAPGTRYDTSESRGIDRSDVEPRDAFEISQDRRSLTVWFVSDGDIDQVRVLIESEPKP